ncbi:MAG: hypothetical protein Kow0069_26660 [Promethearchaeota archaeon]
MSANAVEPVAPEVSGSVGPREEELENVEKGGGADHEAPPKRAVEVGVFGGFVGLLAATLILFSSPMLPTVQLFFTLVWVGVVVGYAEFLIHLKIDSPAN